MSYPNPAVRPWRAGSHQLTPPGRPLVMGILNVTPDSFSDGGYHFDVDAAVAAGIDMARHGADIIDIGGESTRPYSEPVDASEERRRVVPVIERLAGEIDVPISIDTSKASVASAALGAGAAIVNDVTGLEGDPDMARVVADDACGVCVMHMRGTPQTMQDDPTYVDVVAEIRDYLARRRDAVLGIGVEPDRLCLDPGIGFGKTHDHNWRLVRHAADFVDLGHPILVGHSRKGFVKKAVGDDGDRDAGTLGVTIALAAAGVHVVRVHDVPRTVDALECWRRSQPSPSPAP